jgi:transcriptional regulator with AAA-type ATPase domain/tetratricopeptide (TPR) repeat protein
VPDFPELIGRSAAVAALRTSIARLLARLRESPRPPAVLLLGETGTGKGLVARILHDHGPRSAGPFVDVNCAAIPDTLLESELFGFERGAFTDARHAKAGLLQTAHRGTIFLDEVALLHESLQAKLLKVLEERTVRRLGATRSEPTDFWLVAATNADLSAAIAERRFREDLYQRLAVVRLVLPPLRTRDSDILLLGDHFLARAADDYGLARRVLAEDAREALLSYAWPGNIRELANVMERVALLAEGDRVTAAALDLPASGAERADAPRHSPQARTLHAAVQAHLQHVLEENAGNLSRTAAALGISRNTLRARLRTLGIPTEGRRGRPPGRAAGRIEPSPVSTPVEPVRVEASPPEATIRWETRLVTFLRATLPAPDAWGADCGSVLTIMIEKIQNFGGRVNELSTSSAGALFGIAPTDDSCRLAVQAGLSMIKAVERELQGPADAPPLQVSVHTAQALVGHLGSEIQLDQTHKAAILHVLDRLTADARPGSVTVSPITATFLERRFHLRAVGEATAPHAWVVVGHEKRGLDAVRRQTPMIGRDDELSLLAARWRAAQDGRGQIVLLVGEAGLGKSRLLWEFRTSDHLRDGHVLEVQANPPGQVTSYGPFLELFRQYFQVEPDDAATTLRDKVTGKLAVLAPEASECAAAILAFLGLEPDDAGWMDLDVQERARRILDGLRQIILSEVRSRPVLFVVEDLHWLDPASRALIDALADGLASLPLMLVASCRPPMPHEWASQSYFTQLSLAPLLRGQTETILENLLGSDASLASLRDRFIERAGGNPFVAEESVRALVETEVLQGSPGNYRAAHVPDELPLPPTVEELLAARFGRLSASLQQVVDVAAVVGRETPRSAIVAILGRPLATVRDELATLQRLEMLSEVGSGDDPMLHFHHPLLQEVAYNRLPADERCRLHARAYEVLRASENPGLADDTERLARHAFQGRLWPEAITLCTEAAQRAALWGRQAEAAAHLERALAALGHLPESRTAIEQGVDIRLALKSSLTELGTYDRLLQHLQTAEALARRLGDVRRLGQATAFISDYYRLSGDRELAQSYSERALALGRESGDARLQVMANTYLGMVRYGEGDYAAAAERFRSNIEDVPDDVALERLGTAAPAILSRTWLCLCLSELGDFDQAIRLGTEATELAERLPQPVHIATAAAGLGRVLLRRGHVDAAIPILSHGLDVCRAHGVALWLPNLASALGLALVRSSRIEEGLALLEEGIRRAASDRNLVGHSQRLCALGQGYLAASRLEDAQRVAGEALETAARFKQDGNTAWAYWLQGEVSRAVAAYHVAVDHYRRAVEGATALGMRPVAALAELGRAEALHAMGDEGVELIARARAALAALGMSYASG